MPVLLRHVTRAVLGDLIRAAESALSQDCALAHELLVVDDGSDPALESIRELQHLLANPRVRVLRLVQNQGLVYALNAGLTQARYELIARIDGDDFWRPGKLRKQLELLASDPDLTLVGTSMRLTHPHNPSLDQDDLRGGGWQEVLSFFTRVGCPFPHGSILARKDVFTTLGGYPHSATFTHCEDFALWGSWVRFFKVAILGEVFFDYTVSEHQVSARFAEQQRRASRVVHRTFLDLGDSAGIPHAVAEIAQYLHLPLLKTGHLLAHAWMYYDHILVNPELKETVRSVFPDRAIHLYQATPDLLADRFFYLHRGAFDKRRSQHARCVCTVDDLVDHSAVS
jgi:glycosyltransferase involved in cell wall biosynthesis